MRHGLLDAASLQRMLYDALDQSDDMVLILELLDAELIVAAANDAFCRRTGYAPDDLIGQPLLSLVAAPSSGSHSQDIMAAAREARSVRCELMCHARDGPTFWLGLHMMPLRDSSPACFVVLARDITDSLHARQQQDAIQSLLATVFLCVRAPVAIVSEGGLIHMSNPALEQLLGYPPGTLVGRPSLDLLAPACRDAAAAARARQLQHNADYSLPTRLLHANGTEIAAEITSTVVQRDNLKRFRIITLLTPSKAPAMQVPAAPQIHVAGKIRLIGLDDVKEALGPRWPVVEARAMASAEHVIRRRCGSADTVTRTADSGFLICFADATEEEAAFRAAALAREIRARLIGDGEAEETAVVHAIAGTVEVAHEPGHTPDMLAELIGARLNLRMAEIEARARQTLQHAVQAPACWIEPVRSRRSGEVIALFVRLPLDQERNIIAACQALPLQERPGFDFDRLVLGVAAEQVLLGIAHGERRLFLVNVDFEVFLERRRTERYVAACQALDSRLRERLMLVLSGIPRGVPKSRMLECATRLRPFCHSIGFQSDGLDPPPIDSPLLNGAIAVLVENRPPHAALDMEKVTRLVGGLHAFQARVLIRHAHSRDEAKLLARLGVDLMSIVQDEYAAG